jgi:hypothetical protein
MNIIQRLPKGLASFLGGFFVTYGAMASVGFILAPFFFLAAFRADHAERVQAIVVIMPFLNLFGMLLGLIVAYAVLEVTTDRLFRRGVTFAVIFNILATLSSVLG